MASHPSRKTITGMSRKEDHKKPSFGSIDINSEANMPLNHKSVSTLSTSNIVNQGPASKKLKVHHEPANDSMNSILAKLTEQTELMQKQGEVLNPKLAKNKQTEEDVATATYRAIVDHASISSSVPITPATDSFVSADPNTRPASANLREPTPSDEVLRLKLELAHYKNKISVYERSKQGSDAGTGVPSPSVMSMDHAGGRPASTMQSSLSNNALVPSTGYQDPTWAPPQDDGRSEAGDTNGFSRSRAIWGNKGTFQPGYGQNPMPAPDQWIGRGFNQPGYMEGSNAYGGGRLTPEQDMMRPIGGNRRGHRYDNRYGHQNSFGNGYGSYSNQYDPMNMPVGPPSAMGMYPPYQGQPMGTPLSPHAPEFTSSAGAPWKNEVVSTEGQTYLPPTEPLNYRRLLERNVNCNWKYIVDKIVCNNDQQASIFLQQKLKVGTPEQKYEIVEAIVAQAYPLMVNRFGNFLVQRCFEHGTPEQVVKIAEAIRGNTLNLSMDPFGCHVVQKAFDSVPEEYKAIMVHELLRRIPDTVIHRYACHVWQKLFELRWRDTPPQIMKYVNEALQGMWHEVALGETGSLVVQNIFENCLEEDKRPCIEEVLANIDIVAHGQFGNWCIQHICEHGAPADRSRAIDHVIRYAAEYSMDQFASKVVEKCLKIGGAEFLSRYLDRVCEGRPDRPRIPLIDIASDQYGNYLVQYILTHANPQHREHVAVHIRKHMVSLRGSKFGSRVGMLCTNPAVATRPGPGVGPGMGRLPPGPRYGSGYR
ncbi:hypothetical protein MKZ38_000668 [Zalerion maritima]|uniref:PUM-HD domain-containing protein n=1 Tax=Zalerion maritima TaxID=339359 RepID=A0AAD5RSL0_9PEZI|nr:hypothetical protein MKZ38_000668 [Zalerion maritima]